MGIVFGKSNRKKPKRKLARADVRSRIKKAVRSGFQGHAHRFDSSIEYCRQMVESGVPRELERYESDSVSGDHLGAPYYPEKKYLMCHSFEHSQSCRQGMRLATNRDVVKEEESGSDDLD